MNGYSFDDLWLLSEFLYSDLVNVLLDLVLFVFSVLDSLDLIPIGSGAFTYGAGWIPWCFYDWKVDRGHLLAPYVQQTVKSCTRYESCYMSYSNIFCESFHYFKVIRPHKKKILFPVLWRLKKWCARAFFIFIFRLFY